MSDNTTLRDGTGKIITIADREMVERFLKHECPNGEYTIKGPGIEVSVYRHQGLVYPAGGIVDGDKLTPMSLDECIAFYKENDQ